jgi:hypothetical protein
MFQKLICFYLKETVEFYIAWGGMWGPEDVERCKTDFALNVTVPWLTLMLQAFHGFCQSN